MGDRQRAGDPETMQQVEDDVNAGREQGHVLLAGGIALGFVAAALLILVAGQGALASTTGGSQTYQIVDGVRRAKAAEIAAQQGLGNGRIAAQVVQGGRVTGSIEAEAASLLSPKSAISTAGSGWGRWLNTLGQTLSGSKPPPILVRPGSAGTPIKHVLIK